MGEDMMIELFVRYYVDIYESAERVLEKRGSLL
jgi:hypothetical protein